MQYINIPIEDLDAPEFICATSVERATWLCLLRFCYGQENDGVIAGAASWSDRKWLCVTRVTLREIMSKTTELWTWEGEDLRVWRYRIDQQDYWKGRRTASQTNGKLGGRPPKKPMNNPEQNPAETQEETQQEPSLKPRLPEQNPAETQEETQQEPSLKPRFPEQNLAETKHETQLKPEKKERKNINKEEKEIKKEGGYPPSPQSSKSRPSDSLEAANYFETMLAPESEAGRFFDFYESNGWRVGKNPMRDWRAAARNWVRRNTRAGAPASPAPFNPSSPNAHTGGLPDLTFDDEKISGPSAVSESTAAPAQTKGPRE